ncbi:hypothetical protein CC1G_03012 [Coprinopsis cinerea okayama7|uniref:Large ribosomal subunit protein uL29m n=1 Tax=Coprinopsis cinerea (strain Okayama-7 / 130 / ATCC MYA-4618 / FGSC 9003) TaxID=240176 RepID=A8NS31_COPC7|nr:hypothetical protein CC1G_03012 [Coprinopsis cinerea okayama7\|eukprot:XP_001835924.2 hypothetical protein CC1G_03012 [Coprinopsis cinerea okayama7\
MSRSSKELARYATNVRRSCFKPDLVPKVDDRKPGTWVILRHSIVHFSVPSVISRAEVEFQQENRKRITMVVVVQRGMKPGIGRTGRSSRSVSRGTPGPHRADWRTGKVPDLHTLWYVTLRERNLLATQREEARRMGIKINLQAQTVMAGACRKTMARIKAVMNERRLAYQGAVKLIKEHQEQIEDKKLLQLRHDALIEAQQELTAFTKQGRILRRQRLRQEAQARKALEEEGLLKAASETTEAAESSTNAEASSTPAAEATQAVPEPAKESESAPAAPEASSRPQTAAETATAGLFGDVPNRK